MTELRCFECGRAAVVTSMAGSPYCGEGPCLQENMTLEVIFGGKRSLVRANQTGACFSAFIRWIVTSLV